MGKRTEWLCAVVAAAAAVPWTVAPAGAQDSTAVRLRIGPGFEAHSDLLASPFRQHGTGPDLDLAVVHDGLEVTVGAGAVRTGSRFATDVAAFEDVWTASLDARWTRPVASLGAHTRVRLGADLGGMAFVRRHQYSPGYREFFADLAFPLSVSAGLGHELGAGGGRLDEVVDVGVVTLMLRSPFSGTKDLPPAAWAAPWDVRLLRHRLRLTTRASRRVRLYVTHGLTLLATDRERPLRIVRQDLSLGIALVYGGGGAS